MPLGLLQAGNAAEQVFHGGGAAGHHMGFELGQVNDHIGLQHRFNEGELLGSHAVFHGALAPLAAGVQLQPFFRTNFCKAAYIVSGLHHGRVVYAAGRIRQNDAGRAAALYCPRHRPHNGGVGGHGVLRRVLGQKVRLEQHRFAGADPPGSGQGREQIFHQRIQSGLILIVGHGPHQNGRGAHALPSFRSCKNSRMRLRASTRCSTE